MGKIDELIKQMCPEGVKWVKLKDIGTNLDRKRKPITASNRIPGEIPYYGASGIVDYVKDYLFDGDYLLISEDGANLLSRTYRIAFSIHGKTWVNNHAHIIEFKDRSTRKYVEHYLNSLDLTPWIAAGAQPKLTQDSLNSIEIPLPPLPIQEAIVEILDKFDRLSAELQAELQARKTQYEYYRNQLLTRFAPDQQVKEYSLGELCNLNRGRRLVKEQLSQTEGYPVYQNCVTPLGYHSESNCLAGTTIVIGAGAAGDIAFVNEAFWAADDCYYFTCPDYVINKYIYYALCDKQNLLKSRVRKASIPRLARTEIEKIKILVPSLSEQARIVSILDKFEALVNDLSQGLPAEIEAVKEQYEYYRNKLLTFDKIS